MSQLSVGFELIHDVIKHRWVPEIIASIGQGQDKYSQILKANEFLSKTELNRKLILLVEKEAIEKYTVDNKSYYRLLPFGKDLEHIFNHFVDVGNKYV